MDFADSRGIQAQYRDDVSGGSVDWDLGPYLGGESRGTSTPALDRLVRRVSNVILFFG